MPLRRVTGRRRDWPAAVVAGFAGTAVMTATLAVHARFWPGGEEIDYDATDHVTTVASHLIGWTPRTARQQELLFDLVHWGYGSAVAVQYEALRRTLGSDRRAAFAFYLACQGTALVLFPLLGDTPPPWRWRRDVLLSSLSEHALYVATVVAVSRAIRDV